MSWSCPNCQLPLHKESRQWRCANAHSFDIAKEGYVNLLLVQQKNSKQPGDNKQMVNARHLFLQQQYYAPLAQAMAKLLLKYCSQAHLQLFDAGCGEGYYLRECQTLVAQQHKEISISGVDISKFAVQKAAKSSESAEFAVASCFALPLANESQDAVIQVFAPSKAGEIARVLKANGIWLTVSPAANHLSQLKGLLYQTPEQHSESQVHLDGFELLDSQRLSFDFALQQATEREALLMMTPFYWSSSDESKQKIQRELHKVSADFQLSVYQKAD